MTGTVRVFINERGLDVPANATVAEAVSALDAGFTGQLAQGRATITDGRGIAVPLDAPVHAGAILRVVVSARARDQEADAHP
jgi:hypothetical protein